MSKFIINKSKLREIGGGSITGFCKSYGLKRGEIDAVDGRKWFRDGSRNQEVAQMLLKMGLGEWR